MRFAVILLTLAVAASSLRAGEQVRRIQEELRKRNLYFGDVDGRATPGLATALQRYQERKGFDARGTPTEETLTSLGLTASGMKHPEDWPDEIVLRSDRARDLPEAAQQALEAISLEQDEPEVRTAALSTPEPSLDERARDYVASYLRACEMSNPSAELAFYGEPLNYFNHGTVTSEFVQKDVARYYERWPKREYTLVEPASLSTPLPDGRVSVRFRIRFRLESSRHAVRGRTDNRFTIDTSGKDWKIVGMKENRLFD